MPVLFKYVTDLLEAIEDLPSKPRHAGASRDAIQLVANTYIYQWFEAYRSDIGRNPKTLAAIQSLLLPEIRPDRVYGLREDALVKVLMKVLGLVGCQRGKTLQNWRTSTSDGQLATAVKKVMKEAEFSLDGANVTVEELDDVLDKLAGRYRFSSDELRKKAQDSNVCEPYTLLGPIFLRLSSLEGKWLIRCMLKNLTPVVMSGII
jgi:DNA ligase-4